MKTFWHKGVADWVAQGIWGDDRRFGKVQALGIADDDRNLVAGVVYHDYNPHQGHIEISGYATTPRWFTRPVIRKIFAYPFDELGLRLVVARCAHSNTPVRRICRALGAVEHRHSDVIGDGVDEIFSVLTRSAFEDSRI